MNLFPREIGEIDPDLAILEVNPLLTQNTREALEKVGIPSDWHGSFDPAEHQRQIRNAKKNS